MLVREGRVVLVTGKGGVGKTTVAATLALSAALAGRRVLLCETAGARVVPRLFGGVSKGYEPVELRSGLHSMSITSEAAIEDYLLRQIRVRRLYKMVFRNRVMGPFLDAVPGLHDLIQLGCVWDLERQLDRDRPRWDLIVVDAPATGHGLTMLHAPQAMMELTVAGPFHASTRPVAQLIADPLRTSIVLVSLAEELPVNETMELYAGLAELTSQVRAIVLNEVQASPLPDPAWYRAHRVSLEAAANPAGREALNIADIGLTRVERQDLARSRLGTLGVPVVDLPFLCRPNLGADELASLVPALEGI